MAGVGPFLTSIDQIREVQWGKAWQWDCKFASAPAPFTGFFPATEAKRNISQVQSHGFVGFGDTFDIPFASGARTFAVTFLDDHQGTLMKWLDDWIELSMMSRGQGTARLGNIVKSALLVQSDGRGLAMRSASRMTMRQWELWVYPIGELTFSGSSNSEFTKYIQTFRIAGITNPGD